MRAIDEIELIRHDDLGIRVRVLATGALIGIARDRIARPHKSSHGPQLPHSKLRRVVYSQKPSAGLFVAIEKIVEQIALLGIGNSDPRARRRTKSELGQECPHLIECRMKNR